MLSLPSVHVPHHLPRPRTPPPAALDLAAASHRQSHQNGGDFAGLVGDNPNVTACWAGGDGQTQGGGYLWNHNWVEFWDDVEGDWAFINVPPSSSVPNSVSHGLSPSPTTHRSPPTPSPRCNAGPLQQLLVRSRLQLRQRDPDVPCTGFKQPRHRVAGPRSAGDNVELSW